ncbi:hypothetical protein [Halomontanus rarus]|uniref:phage NrS-1 polymerase family protein n=1 Tax=Halomontanus rarus TaxID=3034020 RepID=UPI0023E88DB8|nr:hypothetical protein [Halovivax sp. TS33]
MVDLTAIPETLRARDQWVCWREVIRDGKPTKVPIDPETGSFASSTDERTWSDLETARTYLGTGDADGLGFVFTDSDPIVGVDLDDCRDPETGQSGVDAKAIIDCLESYTEVSPSGTGYHVLLCGNLPEGRNRRGKIELYDRARFFTVTCEHVSGTPTAVCDRQSQLEAVHDEYVQESVTRTDTQREDCVGTEPEESTLSDSELLEKAMAASNGDKFERLWNGNTAGYDSQSEADMALCCLLAFWTGGDRAQLDRLFRRSGLAREKWDEVHYADGSTYGDRTVERAIDTTSEFYEPRAQSDSERSEETQGATRDREYLKRKNQLLAERVDELETKLEEKTELIETLEAKLEQVGNEGTVRDNTRSTSKRDTSLWNRFRSLVGLDR